MGGGVVLVLYGVLFAFLCLIGAAFYSLWRFGRRKQRPFLTNAGRTLFFLWAVALVAGVTFIVGTIIRGCQPDAIFEQAFGHPPDHGITNLRSKTWSFADTESVFLRFTADKAAIAGILDSRFMEVSEEKFAGICGSIISGRPEWWSAPSGDGWRFFVGRRVHTGDDAFTDETSVFAYNERTGDAVYRFLGID